MTKVLLNDLCAYRGFENAVCLSVCLSVCLYVCALFKTNFLPNLLADLVEIFGGWIFGGELNIENYFWALGPSGRYLCQFWAIFLKSYLLLEYLADWLQIWWSCTSDGPPKSYHFCFSIRLPGRNLWALKDCNFLDWCI